MSRSKAVIYLAAFFFQYKKSPTSILSASHTRISVSNLTFFFPRHILTCCLWTPSLLANSTLGTFFSFCARFKHSPKSTIYISLVLKCQGWLPHHHLLWFTCPFGGRVFKLKWYIIFRHHILFFHSFLDLTYAFSL